MIYRNNYYTYRVHPFSKQTNNSCIPRFRIIIILNTIEMLVKRLKPNKIHNISLSLKKRDSQSSLGILLDTETLNLRIDSEAKTIL